MEIEVARNFMHLLQNVWSAKTLEEGVNFTFCSTGARCDTSKVWHLSQRAAEFKVADSELLQAFSILGVTHFKNVATPLTQG